MSSPSEGAARPMQIAAPVVATEQEGAYRRITVRAPQVARAARPGHFLALAVGGDTSAMLLRRSFSIHRVSARDGTVEVVVADAGPGTHWLVARAAGDVIDVVGPVGTPFPLPDEPVACALVGGGYGSAPLSWLAESLRQRGCHVDIVLGAATADRLFGVAQADGCVITTDDGSQGTRGRVTDVLPAVMSAAATAVVHACGPMAMLRAVTDVATSRGALAHVAVEESMACGIGICMTCVMPVAGEDGVTRMVRACVEGPVFRGDRVRWESFQGGRGLVPADALGARGVTP